MERSFFVSELNAAVIKDPRWEIIQRVVSSDRFSTSLRLREFLLYIGECAIRDSPKDATEQQIGIHVFQRSPGYNTSEDSIVRTHARLLRQKLSEYFSREGAAESVIIEIPKGHYLPVFQPAGPHFVAPPSLEAPQPHQETSPIPSAPLTPSAVQDRSRKILQVGVVCLVLALVTAVIAWVRPGLPPFELEMETLWGPFLSGSPPLVIYSDSLFARDSKQGSQAAASFPNQPQRENYGVLLTGTGSVVAVRQLTQLFDAHHATFILKRSKLTAWDDARSTNLIFIGSPLSNSALNILPPMNDFTLLANPDLDGFVNLHPKPGEPAAYSRPKSFFNKDYAVLGLLPGLRQGKWILILDGLSTLGTEAVADFACRPENVAALLRAASFKKREIRPFEALLETTIVGGVPMEAKLITIRTH
jgi:hypothetical protein